MTGANAFDVIVIGLGGAGSAATYHLTVRNCRVLGIEQFTPAHAKGSSHGNSRIIRQAYHESPDYVPMVLRAYELWERLEKDSGAGILQLPGGLILGEESSGAVQGLIRSGREHGLPFEIFAAAEVRRRFPALQPPPSHVGAFETRAGYVRPEAAVEAHLTLAAKLGAELHFEEKVHSWTADPAGEGVSVVTSRGTYRAGKLVVTPGAWAGSGLTKLPVNFSVQRHVMAWFDPGERASFFAPDRLPIYIWEVNPDVIFYGFPITDGPGSGAKFAMHTGGEDCTPETMKREITEEDIAELRAQMKQYLPWLNGPLLRAVACLYTLTEDRHFVISVHPDFPQVSVAAGFSGHGFKFTPVTGEILADLAINGRTRHSIAFLSPGRFRNFEKNGKSAKQTTQ